MENIKQPDDLSDDSSKSSEDMKGSEIPSYSNKKRKTADHVNSSSEESDEEYRPTRSRSGYTYRKYQAKSGEHKCSECGKSFCKKEILKNHMLVHSDVKPHKCPKCTARFKRKGDYNRHMLMHERTKGRIHTCPTCKLTFLRKNEFNRHISNHANLFPYKCKECPDAQFSNGRALNKHTGRTNNTQSKCNVCNKSFKCRTAFKKHTDDHDTDLKKGNCGQCCTTLENKDELKAHLMGQCNIKPFVCRQCSDGFKTKFELVKHEMEHKALKPFRCKDCPEEFRTKAGLNNHTITDHESSVNNQSNYREVICNGNDTESGGNDNGLPDDIKMNNGKIPNSFQAAFIKETLKCAVSDTQRDLIEENHVSENGERNGDSIKIEAFSSNVDEAMQN